MHFSQYHSVRVVDTHLGIPISLYLDQLIGLRLKGQTSGTVSYTHLTLPTILRV